jgi:sulfur carrier protein
MGQIILNGTTCVIGPGVLLGDLLRELELDPRWVVAELNGEPLPRDRFAHTQLSDGDRLELVRPVAGG